MLKLPDFNISKVIGYIILADPRGAPPPPVQYLLFSRMSKNGQVID